MVTKDPRGEEVNMKLGTESQTTFILQGIRRFRDTIKIPYSDGYFSGRGYYP